MTVNPTNNSGNSSSIAQIDVASVVDQLMQIESKPLDQINKKIEKQTAIISDYGTIKSKMSLFADALKAFENKSSYNATKSFSSNSAIANIFSSNGATPGNYTLEVTGLATASQLVKEGLQKNAALNLTTNPFEIEVPLEKSEVTFSSLTSGQSIILAGRKFTAGDGGATATEVADAFTTSPSVESGSVSGGTFTGAITNWTVTNGSINGVKNFVSTSPGNVQNLENSGSGNITSISTDFLTKKKFTAPPADVTDISKLVNWVNSLDINVKASLVAANVEESSWKLIIQSTQTGIANAVTISGTNDGNLGLDPSEAEDAIFELNGLEFTRSSNTVTDVLQGVTLEFYKKNVSDPITLQIRNDSTDFSNVVESMVTSYNDLIDSYKTMTANSLNSSTPGNFATDPTSLSFINEIKSRFTKGIYYGSNFEKRYSFASMGIDFQLDGTLRFDKNIFNSSVNSGLQDILRDGIQVAYAEGEDGKQSSLSTYLNDYLKVGGYFRDILQQQTESSWNLLDQQERIQTRLNSLRQGYITQYSALNALLYQLSSTSNALGSALDALNNQNQN